jgi:signal transduction histidine kinase
VTTVSPVQLAVDLTTWPGVVLRIAAGGEVVASNGRLESLLDADVVGRPLSDLLDRDSSLAKSERLLRGASGPASELIFCTAERMLETGAYTAVPAGDERWLVEHPVSPRLVALATEVASVNAELATTQRELVIGRARLEHAKAELERSNAALDEFAHAVSHDLKAPLRGIREYADVVLESVGSSPTQERRGELERIQALAERMRRMIEAALGYARAGRRSDRIEPVDTGRLLRELVEYLAPPQDVVIHIAPDLPTILTERVPFEQVFRNLLSNAVTYRRESGARIEVCAEEAGGHWRFLVADNGPGIGEAQQARIWRLFHTSRPGDGTGLGLAMVKRIVESHGGAVRVRSAPGAGATFEVEWPRRATPPSGGARR